MTTWALVVLLWNPKFGNNMTTIPNFTSEIACQTAGEIWAKKAGGWTATPYTYCIEVK